MPITLNPNTYLANLTNLCLQVLTFDNLNFTNRFGAFGRQYTKFGDKIACVNAWVQDGKDYALGDDDFDNPFNADKPLVDETTITTKLKKRYSLQLAEDLLRGAFEDENSLQMFLTTLIRQLKTKSEIDIYEMIVTDFATKDMAGFETNPHIEGSLDTPEDVVNLYVKIIETAQKMKLPNTNYGLTKISGALQQTCAEGTRIILYVTPEAFSKISTYVNASLYNSSAIALSKWIDEVKVVDVEDNDTVPNAVKTHGFLATEDVYRYSPRIETIREQPNGGNLTFNYYYHVWTNAGFTGAGQLAYIYSR